MGRRLHFTSIMARDHATKGGQLSPPVCSGRRTRTRYPRGRAGIWGKGPTSDHQFKSGKARRKPPWRG